MSYESVRFGDFLRVQREKLNKSREELCEGLYTPDMLGRIESGTRYPEKMMRDCLLARLGETGYDYECYLQPEEYEQWKERRIILDSLDDGELDKAEQLLAQYEKNNDMTQKVSRQFWMVMRMQWLELKGAPEEERFALLEQTVKLTIPKVDSVPVSELLLSVQEVNLVVEYITYKQEAGLTDKYLELLQYMEQSRFDLESRALLCSKIALYYCRQRKQELAKARSARYKLDLAEQILLVCNCGTESVRNHKKAYFAWELLQEKAWCLQQILECKKLLSEEENVQYEKELEQTRTMYAFLDKKYKEYNLPRETNQYTFFYREREIYCINEVIRVRRRMLGYSRLDLEDYCAESTLKRLEKGKSRVQLRIAQKLFRKLGLSMETHRAQIVTDSQEAIMLEKKYREASNLREYEQAEILLKQLKERISMKELINRQYVEYEEKFVLYKEGRIDREEYIKHAQEILLYTISYDAAIRKIEDVRFRNGKKRVREKYLTNMEVTILTNMANALGSEAENIYWRVLQEYFEKLEAKCTMSPIFGMYGFVMSSVASYLGNMGNYEDSCRINRKITKESLRLRDMSYLHRNLYGLLWNDRKKKGLPMEIEDPEWRQGLLDCLMVDVFCKDKFRENRMRKRLNL